MKVHTALLAGLLSHVGVRDGVKQDYLGARGTRFSIFPGSALFKKQTSIPARGASPGGPERSPRWVVAAELVETSRLWARVAARVERPERSSRLAGSSFLAPAVPPRPERCRRATGSFAARPRLCYPWFPKQCPAPRGRPMLPR